jgi:pheromone a factor receptor
MSLSIVVPYVPVQVILFVISMRGTVYHPYSYQNAHRGTAEYPWNSIFFIPSWMMDFPVINQPWIPIFTTIPIVIFFGMTTEAVDTYRKFLLLLGFGTCFQALKEPYDPDRAHKNADITGRALFASSQDKVNRTNGTDTNKDE